MSEPSQIHDLQQAVFHSVYRSGQQRRRRALATLLIFAGQILRTLLLVWPVGVLILISVFSPDSIYGTYILLVLAPGLMVWGFMLVRGTRKDYCRRVQGQLLKNRDLGRFLYPPRPWHQD